MPYLSPIFSHTHTHTHTHSQDGAALYYLDYLASMQKLNFGAHGYGANFTLSVFDREWKEGMSLEEAKVVMQHAVDELKVRFLISQPMWIWKVVDKDGIRVL